MAEEKTYIGTKIVKAFEQSYGEFVLLEKNISCEPETANKAGYRVEYEDGYVSWSPKEVFERCYREITVEEKKMM
ncbi:MAG: hypothetical protein OEY34_07600 [Cyclobacteriaceae bacterium]|nr:hypothetical protein [Cyclobacteriaceae bacterium]